MSTKGNSATGSDYPVAEQILNENNVIKNTNVVF